jgi:ESX-1-secreted protein regulator
MADLDPPPSGTFTERLRYVRDRVRRPDGQLYSAREIAEAMGRSGHRRGKTYVADLIRGGVTNPTTDDVAALARFFGVRQRDLLGDEDEQRAALADGLRRHGVRKVAMRDPAGRVQGGGPDAVARAVEGLPREALEQILEIVKTYRRASGLPDDQRPE